MDGEGEGGDELVGLMLDIVFYAVVVVLQDASGFGPEGEVGKGGFVGFGEVDARDGRGGLVRALLPDVNLLGRLVAGEVGYEEARDLEDTMRFTVDDHGGIFALEGALSTSICGASRRVGRDSGKGEGLRGT